jgi:hypothetical protein
MTMVGHNGGPTVEPGTAWRTHCWTAARAELLPKLPLEVIRLRVKRAAEIGLDYKTYAGVRATTGHDIVACLFSTNALRLLREGQGLGPDRIARLQDMRNTGRLLAVQPPLDPGRTIAVLNGCGISVDAAAPAPTLAQSWSQTRAALRGLLEVRRHPADTVLLVGDNALERDWTAAAGLAGYLPADRFFPG